MKYNDYGSLRIRAYAAESALPVEGVIIKIYGTDDYNKDAIHSVITDNDGLTDEIILPAPDSKYSGAPSPSESPYAVYNIELAKDGFYPKIIENIPIFAGIKAVVPIEMIPFVYYDDGSLIPQKNLNSVIYENEKL